MQCGTYANKPVPSLGVSRHLYLLYVMILLHFFRIYNKVIKLAGFLTHTPTYFETFAPFKQVMKDEVEDFYIQRQHFCDVFVWFFCSIFRNGIELFAGWNPCLHWQKATLLSRRPVTVWKHLSYIYCLSSSVYRAIELTFWGRVCRVVLRQRGVFIFLEVKS
mgnify:CR=1 FL=1